MCKEASICFMAIILVTVGRTSLTNQSCLEAILTDIKMLLKMLPNSKGNLYTPENHGVKCIKEAMECFMKEMDIIKEEHENNIRIINTTERVQRNVKACWNGTAGDECPQCESYGGQNYKLFLTKMMKLVQLANHNGH